MTYELKQIELEKLIEDTENSTYSGGSENEMELNERNSDE